MNEPSNPFGITRDEILNLAAQKVADEYPDNGDIEEMVRKQLRDRVEQVVNETVLKKIDAFLTEEMTKIVSQEIAPLTIWGERIGKPTTIKNVLSERARVFWETKVNAQGSEESYGGTARSTHLMTQIVDEQFKKAIKENLTEIVGAFKEAIKKDAVELTKKHIDSLIK